MPHIQDRNEDLAHDVPASQDKPFLGTALSNSFR